MEWLLAFVRRAAKPLGLGIGTPNKMSSSISIDDAMAEASPFLRRMRLEGYDSAAVPFAEKHVQAWLRGPGVQMDTNTLINVLKVRLIVTVHTRMPLGTLPASYLPSHNPLPCSAEPWTLRSFEGEHAAHSTFCFFCVVCRDSSPLRVSACSFW